MLCELGYWFGEKSFTSSADYVLTFVEMKSQMEIKWIIRDYGCLNWVHLVIKMPNLENIEFYTCTLWDPQCKIFNYGLQEELMGAK